MSQKLQFKISGALGKGFKAAVMCHGNCRWCVHEITCCLYQSRLHPNNRLIHEDINPIVIQRCVVLISDLQIAT